jgi:hypothetical protein
MEREIYVIETYGDTEERTTVIVGYFEGDIPSLIKKYGKHYSYLSITPINIERPEPEDVEMPPFMTEVYLPPPIDVESEVERLKKAEIKVIRSNQSRFIMCEKSNDVDLSEIENKAATFLIKHKCVSMGEALIEALYTLYPVVYKKVTGTGVCKHSSAAEILGAIKEVTKG